MSTTIARPLALLAAPLAVLALAACSGDTHMATGWVTDKHFSAGSTFMSHGVLSHHENHYYLDLADSCDNIGKNCKQHGSRSVTETQYNSVKVGDYYRG